MARDEPVDRDLPLEPGDVVTAYAVGNNNTIGKVAKREDGKVYVYKPFGPSGKIDARDPAMVKPIEIGGREYKVGETVQAYEFGSGFREATVQTVEDGGLVHSILITGATSPKRCFFGALMPTVG